MRTKALHALATVALLTALGCSNARADASADQARLGVWHGTLGTHPVMVDLNPCNMAVDSQYYYLNHLFGIVLKKQDPQGTVWDEVSGKSDSVTAQWKLSLPVGNHLAGEWVSTDGQRRLPISLTRAFVPKDGGNTCSKSNQLLMQQAFDGPRIAAQKPSISQSTDGSRSVSALGDNIQMMELPDNAAHAKTFNAAQRAWFQDNIAGYYNCALHTSVPPDYSQRRAIVLQTGSWVVVEETFSVYCGGAHPDGGIVGYQTWNLDTGKIVEPWTWIKHSKVPCGYSTGCGFAAPEKLNAIILAHATRNERGSACADATNENHQYQIWPSAKGLVFSTSFAHVIQACDEDIEIPYAQLQPFLTPAGKAATATIQRGIKSNAKSD